MVLSLLAACTGASPTDTGGEPEGHFVAASLAVTNTVDDSDADTDSDEPVPIDADSDGYFALESGGDDCDDTNENVHPDAEDWCTAADENCDGVAIDPGRCSDIQAFLSRGRKLATEGYDYMLPVRDLTGDGLDDILVSTYAGATGVSPGDGTWAGFATWPLAAQWDVPYGCTWDEVRLDVGDIDGDGFNDVPIPSAGCGGGYDIAWGPFDGGDPTPPLIRWEGPEPSGYLSELRMADVDADGNPDLLTATLVGDDGFATVYFGGQRAAETATITSPHAALINYDSLGDIDNDGFGDVLYSDLYGNNWIRGIDLQRGASLDRDDLIAGTLADVDGVTINGESSFPPFVTVGDWSGDGTDDVVYVDSHSDRGSVLYYDDFSPAEVSPSGRVDNDDVVEDHLGVYPGLLRLRGVAEMLFLSNNTTEPEQYILLPNEWHTGTANLSEVRHLVTDNLTGDEAERDRAYRAGSWGLGDLDQDGWSDVVIFSNAGPWYLTPFDDIPWNEPQYW